MSSAAWKLFRDWSKDLNCSSNLPTVLKTKERQTGGPQTDRWSTDGQVLQRQTGGPETDGWCRDRHEDKIYKDYKTVRS